MSMKDMMGGGGGGKGPAPAALPIIPPAAPGGGGGANAPAIPMMAGAPSPEGPGAPTGAPSPMGTPPTPNLIGPPRQAPPMGPIVTPGDSLADRAMAQSQGAAQNAVGGQAAKMNPNGGGKSGSPLDGIDVQKLVKMFAAFGA